MVSEVSVVHPEPGRLSYTTLDPAKIIATAERLARRVAERFPSSGLAEVSADTTAVARICETDARRLGDAHWPLRLLVAAILAAGLLCLLLMVHNLRLGPLQGGAVQLATILETTMNIAVTASLGVLGLTRLESSWKRRRAMASLHRLRSLAHVIDMHQLTKDPGGDEWSLTPTASSPRREFGRRELARYLDYCSELLSLIGKMAALYAQSHPDGVVVQSVNDIEMLTTNLSRKIWQKIAIAQTAHGDQPVAEKSDGSGKAPAGL